MLKSIDETATRSVAVNLARPFKAGLAVYVGVRRVATGEIISIVYRVAEATHGPKARSDPSLKRLG